MNKHKHCLPWTNMNTAHHDVQVLVEAQLDELAETRRVVVHQGLGIAKGLKQRVELDDLLFQTLCEKRMLKWCFDGYVCVVLCWVELCVMVIWHWVVLCVMIIWHFERKHESHARTDAEGSPSTCALLPSLVLRWIICLMNSLADSVLPAPDSPEITHTWNKIHGQKEKENQ